MKTMKTSALIKTGFALSIGSILATLIFLAIGLGIFIAGFVMWAREKKAASPNKTVQVVGIVLMALGCLVGLGVAAPILMAAIGDML